MDCSTFRSGVGKDDITEQILKNAIIMTGQVNMQYYKSSEQENVNKDLI
jgi:hypothetical protein